jgi:hypothetical protein
MGRREWPVPPVMPRAGTWCTYTERGQRLAAIVPAEFAEALEGMSEQDARDLLEDLADAAAAREALKSPASPFRGSRSGLRPGCSRGEVPG